MGWTEHLGGNKYKLVERDPSKVKRPKRSISVEVPADIAKSARKTEKWLAVQLADWEEKVLSGQVVGRVKTENISFKDFVPIWKEGHAKQNLGGKTLLNTMGDIERRLIPEFGDMPLSKITTLQLVTWFAGLTNKKTGEPLATNSKLNIYKAAKSIFDAAYKWKLIKENPMEGVPRPSANKKEKKAMRSKKQNYTMQEVETLLAALYDLPNNWRLYFTGVLLGGFRRGEYLAVEWSDLDFDRNAIWIEDQITLDEEGKKVESEVKTEESEAWVAMPKWYMEELKRYERQWRKEKLLCKNWQGGEKQYIFHGGNGVMYYPSTPTLTWRRFLAKHGLPHVKLHGLRHTAGMLLRESGVDLKTIQERLRHTKIGTTADIYTHESAIISREAADRLEVLNPELRRFAP
ncbi:MULTISPECIES: tyrosine-type recombinase/integrase [Paenibacillus]|uniref:tyrosine-type recombinase/integrase n=1 Tax=Paenibacillus TaxID=44249 RepID=UPI00119D24D3|nr:site-specific integrase [Paenibacillus sp. IHBB 10380]